MPANHLSKITVTVLNRSYLPFGVNKQKKESSLASDVKAGFAYGRKDPMLWLTVTLFLFWILLFSLTLYPGPGGRINYGDSAKFQYLPLVDGVPHSTGYPLYLLISKLFKVLLFFLPLWARISAISVLCGALSLTLLFRLAFRLSANAWGSVLCSVIVGTTYLYWTQSTEAEVYALSLALLSGMLLYLFRYQQEGDPSDLLTTFFLYALSLGVHLTVISMFPVMLYVSFRHGWRRLFTWRILGLSFLFVLLSIGQYGYLYYLSHTSDAQYLEYLGKDTSITHLASYATGGQFGGSSIFSWETIWDRDLLINVNHKLEEAIHYWLRDLNVIGLCCVMLGFLVGLQQEKTRESTAVLLAAWASYYLLAMLYNIEEGLYFLPLYLIGGVAVSFLFSGSCNRKVQFALVLLVILINCYTNIANRDIVVKRNGRLERFLAIVKSLPSHSTLLYREMSDYANEKLRLYVTLSGEYQLHNLVVITQPRSHLKSMVQSPRKGIFSQKHQVYLTEYSRDLLPAGKVFTIQKIGNHRPLRRYIKHRLRKGQVLLMAINGEGVSGLSSKTLRYFSRKLGSSLSDVMYGGAFAAAITGRGTVIEEMNNHGPARISLSAAQLSENMAKEQRIAIYSPGQHYGNQAVIQIGTKKWDCVQRGLFIVTLNAQGTVIDKQCFDTHLHEFHPSELLVASLTPPTLLAKVNGPLLSSP